MKDPVGYQQVLSAFSEALITYKRREAEATAAVALEREAKAAYDECKKQLDNAVAANL